MLLPPLLGLGMLAAAPANRVLVLDDFESSASAQHWSGGLALSSEHAAHGRSSGIVRWSTAPAEAGTQKIPHDWSAYDQLRFDVYSGRDGSSSLSLRIDDDIDFFRAAGKIFIQKGWNHVEVMLTTLQTETGGRPLRLDRIQRLALSPGRGGLPWTVYLDNFRLVAGSEAAASASRQSPADTVILLQDRWYSIHQTVRPEAVPESAEVARLRAEAERENERLAAAIRAAHMQGIDTIYSERHLVTADLGLRVRPRLAWFNNDERKREMFAYVARSCRAAREELEDVFAGRIRLPEIDDTRMPEPLVPPLPVLKGRPREGRFFRDDRGEPLMVLSLHSPSVALQRFFASPLQHIESYSAGGGSRWSIEESPVWEAFHKYPDTHRVGWDGWCGHLIRDLSSMGGSSRDNTVICLESPHIRDAIEKYIGINIPKFRQNPELLYDILGYELMYICYCDRSQQMFREWLGREHGTLERANAAWGTAYKNFSEVAAPPVKNSRPLPGTNRGLWYDWARFNQDRFTRHLIWVRDLVKRVDPSTPLAAGGSSSMLAGRMGTAGIDEEQIVNQVGDIIIQEGGGSTMGLDLQIALAETKKPVADPEMSLESAANLLPHFLHGKSVAQLYHWPSQPSQEFISVTNASMAHSLRYPLPDVGEILRAALDLRRLNKEVAAFVDVPAEVAILYSHTSMLQIPPEMLTWRKTPYLAELENTYEASRNLDARVTFVTERQILKGWLERYKLLLVPAARNVPAAVVERIRSYAAAGGRVLILPESLLGDEYNRAQDYLARLGIVVTATRRPKPGTPGSMTQGYDQSFSQDVAIDGGGGMKLNPVRGKFGEPSAQGVRQTVQAGAAAEVLFRYPDGGAAILRLPDGRGAVYYSTCSLERSGFASFLDALFEEAGVTRPVRVRGGEVEARFASLGDRKLLYVVNYGGAPARLRAESAPALFNTIRDLRESRQLRGRELEIPAGQTAIYELTK